jgi:formate dehydrogenase iron-sulfur subunit
MALTRRDFFKLSGSAGMAVAVAAGLEPETAAAEAASTEQFGVLIDISRCIGCRSCEAACKTANDLPPETESWEKRQLDARRFTFVDKRQISEETRQVMTRFVKRQCMHCLEPACASVCPVGALHKDANGAVAYDDEKCIGCRYCMTACPFDVPRYEWESTAPLIRKCQFCTTRLDSGQGTACSGACPAGTIKVGKRSDLLVEAEARIQQNPDRYVDYIYGKDEVGGTSALYLSNVPFEELGFKMNLPKDPLPERTHAVMSKLPALVMGMAVVLGTGTVLSSRANKKNGNGNGNGNVETTITIDDAGATTSEGETK